MSRLRRFHRRRVAVFGAVVAAFAAATILVTVPAVSVAAAAAAPVNTAEPSVTGTTRVGQVLRTTNGSWSGTEPIDFTYRWYRCGQQSRPDASDCDRIASATAAAYELRLADAGYRIRAQVTAHNADGDTTATSNPTSTVLSARPANVTPPTISGQPVVGNRLSANRGDWVGDQPITFSFGWLRCSAQGTNCSEISGETDSEYTVKSADLNRTLRVRVTARNDRGTRSAISNATAVVGQNPPPPSTGSLAVSELQAAGDRLVVSEIRFSPNPVASRTQPITAHVRVTARGGRAVSGALVFMRATPRVVRGQTQATQQDGWVTLTLVPNRFFPAPRNGQNVQFFIKAYRPSDPPLGGVAGYRLVQVRLAS